MNNWKLEQYILTEFFGVLKGKKTWLWIRTCITLPIQLNSVIYAQVGGYLPIVICFGQIAEKVPEHELTKESLVTLQASLASSLASYSHMWLASTNGSSFHRDRLETRRIVVDHWISCLTSNLSPNIGLAGCQFLFTVSSRQLIWTKESVYMELILCNYIYSLQLGILYFIAWNEASSR